MSESTSPVSILSAAVKQFGAGMLVAAVFALAVARVYSDLAEKNDALVSLVREQTRSTSEVAEALRELARQLETRGHDSN
jgi:hypothetical protein